MVFHLFRRKRPPLSLTVAEVPRWLSSFQEEIGLREVFDLFLSEMRRHLKHLLERLDILESLPLPDADADLVRRVRSHRDAFLQRAHRFIEEVHIPHDFRSFRSFAESFSELVSVVQIDLQKDFFFLKDFFEREVVMVMKVLSAMDRSVADLRVQFHKFRKEQIDEVYVALERYEDVLLKRTQIARALDEEQHRLREPQEKLLKLQRRIDEIRSSQQFRRLQDREASLQSLLAEERSFHDQLARSAKPFMGVFRKYVRLLKSGSVDRSSLFGLSDDLSEGELSLLSAYARDFVRGLLRDDDLFVARHLDVIRSHLSSFGLASSSEKTVRSSLKKVSLAWLNSQKKRLDHFQKDVSSLRSSLAKDTTALLLREQEQWLRSTQTVLDESLKTVRLLSSELERLNPRLYLQKIRDALLVLQPGRVVEVRSDA